MKKADLAVLEKAFAAEVERRLPFQSRSEIAHRLAKEGYLQPMEITVGAGTRFPVLVKGFELTHAGRLMYCASCDQPAAEEGRDGNK